MGEDVVLNSKGEYNRCTIGRLTLGDEDSTTKDNRLEKDEEEEGEDREDNVRIWVKGNTDNRRVQEIGQQID